MSIRTNPTRQTISGYRYGSAATIHTVHYLAKPIIAALKVIGARRILDMGCGNGSITRLLHAEGFHVVGVDPSAGGIAHCRSLMPDASFYEMGIYDDPAGIRENDFDAAICSEVVEHLYSPHLMPLFAKSKLRSEGHLILTTPYHGYWKNLVLSLAGKWDKHWMPLREGGHIKFWSAKTLKQLLDDRGFDVLRTTGCGRCSFLWKSLLIVARKRCDE